MPSESSEPKKIDQMLATIRQHRAFFFGGREAPFSSLRSFFAGFALCLEMVQQGDNAEELLLPPEFRAFVARQLGLSLDNTLGWQQWLLMKTDSEEAAFEKFFELWESFTDQSSTPAKKKSPSRPKATKAPKS